jgi:antitoxin MazE
MKVNLIRIGNSQGIRIPKPIIEQCGFRGSVDIRVEDNVLVVATARAVREGWDEAFEAMAGRGDDALIDRERAAGDWDETDWRW